MLKGLKLEQGSCLVELLVVLLIVGVLLSIGVPVFVHFVWRAESTVCDANCSQLGKMYHLYLMFMSEEHLAELFEAFLAEYEGDLCPAGGQVNYYMGRVRCGLHFGIDSGADEAADCAGNRLVFGDQYRFYLAQGSLDHDQSRFVQFLEGHRGTICGAGGTIGYGAGAVTCSIHATESDDGDGGVPFL